MLKFLGELLTLNLYNALLFREWSEEAMLSPVKYGCYHVCCLLYLV